MTSLYSSLGRPTGRLPPVNSPYRICLGRRSMGIRCIFGFRMLLSGVELQRCRISRLPFHTKDSA